jgi:parvulin-like peptidyl-prolyl isomerase
LAQKYEFLQIDLAVPKSPTPEVLALWFEAHKDRYLSPELVSFSHVYFSTDKVGEEAARLQAQKALASLQQSKRDRQPDLGDPFPGPADVAAMSQKDAARLFGESDIVKALFQAPANQWVGPVKSAFGWHLIHVTERLPAKQPVLDDVRDWVSSDWIEDQRRLLRERAFEKLRAKYTVRDKGDKP